MMRALLLLVFLLPIGLCAQDSTYTPRYGDKSYYLVDSLDLNALSEGDRALIDTSLAHYMTESNDSAKLFWLEHIAEYCNDNKVWPKYNQLTFDMSLNKLKSSPNNKAYLKYKASALNNFGFEDGKSRIEKQTHYHEALQIVRVAKAYDTTT